MSDGGRNTDTNHVLDEQLSGSSGPRRRVRRPKSLAVVPEQRVEDYDEPSWVPLSGVPRGGRAECRDGERPCPYVQCEHHLWLEDGEDRVGPRWRGPLKSKLLPRWMERPTPPSCELDVRERREGVVASNELRADGTLSIEAIAKAIGKTPDWTQRVLARALKKLGLSKRLKEIGKP